MIRPGQLNPAVKNGAAVGAFVLVVLGLFAYLGEVVTAVSGGGVAKAPVEGISPEAGESIYFGRGKCSTCHSVGDQGSAIRGPNHGVNAQFGEPLAVRAEARAQERAKATGRPYTATEYLVESLADPSAYVVSGYKDEMPLVYRPPVKLSPDEVKAVILFLQSLGGEVDPDAIKLPRVILAAAREPDASPWEPYIAGDAEEGQELFFDEESNAGCARCHTVEGKGGDVGPELTTVAGTRTAKFIVESILEPSAQIASGYEPYLVETTDGRLLTGILKEDTPQHVSLKTDTGELLTIPRAEVKEVVPQEISIMPGSFADDLNVQEFHDVLAFVMKLTGEKPEEGTEEKDEEEEDQEKEADGEDGQNEERPDGAGKPAGKGKNG